MDENTREFLRECSSCLDEADITINGLVIADLVAAGFTVTLGTYSQEVRPTNLRGKPYAQIVNRAQEINASTSNGSDSWDALRHVLDFVANSD